VYTGTSSSEPVSNESDSPAQLNFNERKLSDLELGHILGLLDLDSWKTVISELDRNLTH
jgi:hypothetical protein